MLRKLLTCKLRCKKAQLSIFCGRCWGNRKIDSTLKSGAYPRIKQILDSKILNFAVFLTDWITPWRMSLHSSLIPKGFVTVFDSICQLYHDYSILPCLKNGCWFNVLLLARFPKLYIHFYCSEELRQVIYWQCFNRIISSQPHLKIVNVWILTSCFAHVTVVEFIQITYKNLKLLTHVDWGSAPHFLCNSNLACVFLEVAYPVNTMPSTNLKSPLVKALLLFCSKRDFHHKYK